MMSRSSINRSAVDLTWSLWTELGVPGVIRNHRDCVLDPEPLVVVSPYIAAHDPRLRDQIYLWCRANARWISVSRLQGLLRLYNQETRGAFWDMAKTLRTDGSVKWPANGEGRPWPSPPDPKPLPMTMNRPALLRMRLRALCGVGARSDVLCELIARGDGWFSAVDFEGEGYTKRNMARILADLSDAGYLARRPRRNVVRYKLITQDELHSLLSVQNLRFPKWTSLFHIVILVFELLDHQHASAAVRRVEAHKLREKLLPQCIELALPPPPLTKGEPKSWERVVEWAAEELERLSSGSSQALQSD